MRKYILLLLLSGILIPISSFSQNPPGDPLSKRYVFGKNDATPLIQSLTWLDTDSISRSLAAACILGTNHAELQEYHFPDLDTRIENLVSKGILKLSEGKYYLTFPVILGKKRELMYDLVWKKAMSLLPVAEPTLTKLRKELGVQKYIAFHLLWSRIINQLYIELWHARFPDEKNDPNETWLIYPMHPSMIGNEVLQVGEKASLAISWNYNCLPDKQQISSLSESILAAAVTGHAANPLLEKYGLVDEKGNSRIFSYSEGDRIDKLCRECLAELLPSFSNLYDYKSLATTFEIPEKDIFLIVLHETAYSLFENLQQLNKLELPAALTKANNDNSMFQLVSLKMTAAKQ